MSASQAPPWSPQQREWLQALGHPPMVLVGPHVDVAAAPLQIEPAGEAAPVSGEPPVAARPAAAALQRALLRATGLPAAEAAYALQSLDVDVAALRSDPAAKRRLWSRLRRVRRNRPA